MNLCKRYVVTFNKHKYMYIEAVPGRQSTCDLMNYESEAS